MTHVFKVTTRSGTVPWVAALGPENRVFCYLPLSGKFHFNKGLHHDYYLDQDLTFEPIDTTEAVRLINAGVGQHNEKNQHVAQGISESKWSMSAEEVLGDSVTHIVQA